MRRWPFLLIVAAAIGVGACGSSTSPSTTTTTAAATLAITPTTGAVAVGQVMNYSVLNSATGDTIAWSSSDASIFSVDTSGNVTGISRGTGTLTATASSGPTATLQIQVAPSYVGTWSGSAAVTACTDIGGYTTAGYCAQRIHTVQRITVSFTQNGLGVAGTLTQAEPSGQVSGPVTGAIGTGGDISSLVGTLTGVIAGSNTATALISWTSLATDAGLTGSFAANVTSPQIVGIATVQWQFSGVPKVAINTVPTGGLWALLTLFRHR
jgi:hypothetical protein